MPKCKPTYAEVAEVGRTPNVADEINGLSQRLDAAYRFVAGNLPDNASLRIEQTGAGDDRY